MNQLSRRLALGLAFLTMIAPVVAAGAPLRVGTSAGPYAEILDDPRVAKLIAIYRSPEVKKFILDRFGGTIIPTW